MDKKTQGKKNRASGADFERRVRKDLEEKGWIVAKWTNNVSEGKLVPAKHKFRGVGIPMAIGTGFPDFIAFKTNKLSVIQVDSDDPKQIKEIKDQYADYLKNYPEEQIICGQNVKIIPKFEMMAVECKTNGYLDKQEREKCKWLLDNNIFSKILIVSKHKIKNRIVIKYNEFK